MATSITTPNPNLSSFIWSVADLLRGDYKQSEYGKVILPFTVLRRLDCVLEATKADVLAEKAKRETAGLNPEPFLLRKSGQFFYNTSSLDLKKLMGDQDHIGENLRAYLQAFSPAVRDIFESFEFHTQIDKLLAKPGVVRSLYDPTAGTGGMLSVAGEHLVSLNPDAKLVMYGQELNPESYAICKADMLIKG